MHRSSLYHQREAKRSVRKEAADRLYSVCATKRPDKAEQRALAEQAYNEWLNKRSHHRTINLTEVLRRSS